MIDAFSMAYSQLLARIALPAAATLLAVLAATGACRAAGCASRRIRRAGGVVTVTFLCTWILAMMGSGSPPTREEKEQMRAAQAEVAAERAAIGGILVGQSAIHSTFPRIENGELTMENEGASRGDSAILLSQFSINNSDYAAGFALVHAGTGEVFDFSPTPNADVCEEWRRFGAANDRQRISLVDDAYDGYAGFPFGTNVIRKLTVFSDGEACVATTNASTTISPLKCVSGILPASQWGLIGGGASQFWSCLTPSNSFVMTWQNVAFGRNPGCLVSFQSELYENGDMEFRYDLSALGDGVVSNVVAGAMNEGAGTTFGELSADTTSLRFARLDPTRADDPDPDGDGITTADEIFVYGTSPYESDSDHDGLGDYAEINETNTDPNDAYSADGVYNDRLAVALGGLDPFSCPDGSTNSVLEHVFYSGTTNGAFAYPVSTDEIGVLKITVSGSGSGRLLVGDAVVPLVGFGTNTLLLAVGKGVRKDLRWDVPDGLDVALGSDDLVIGELPTLLRWKGWIAFPHTDAEIPCIHDLNAKRKTVSLVHGEEFPGLTAVWACGSEDVDIWNLPPVSAEITGNFSTRESRSVSYTVDHPKRLTPSPLVVSQTIRFCPSLSEDEEEHFSLAEEYVDEELWNCACALGGCTCCSGGWCHCHVACCPCNSERDPSIGETDDQEAANAFSNIVAGVLQEKSNALYLYRANSDVVHLDVPTGEPPFCCGCPDHCHGNYAAKAFCSSRLEVLDGAGMEFGVTNASCDVSVRGVSPSRAFDDASALFVTNGVAYRRMDYTVLGVRFESSYDRPGISVYNGLSPTLGYPVHVCTNLVYADSIAIRTDILLDEGFVRLSLEGEYGDAGLWLPEWTDERGTRHPAEALLQGGVISVRHMPIEIWRGIARRYYDPRRVELKVVSSSPQRFSVRAEFVSSDGGGYVHDVALQRISSVKPALLPDYDRDGLVGASDARHNRNGGLLYFWTNRDTWRGDDAFAAYGEYSGIAHPWPITLPCNGDDMVVNGRNDLVNLCPLAFDLSAFVSEWDSSRVVYRFFTGNPGAVRFVPTTTKWDSVGMIVSEDQKTVSGVDLHEATLMTTSLEGWHENGYELPAGLLALGAEGAGVIAAEFATPGRVNLHVEAIDSDSGYVLFESGVDVVAQDVHDMYRWLNLDYAIGVETDPKYDDRLWVGWPDAEHSDANVVFVHGYNVHPQEAWDWSQAMFKRLWWSGMDAGFTAVLWRGNESQAWVPIENCYATINYHQNVLNAFRTAETFAARVNALPGAKKFMIAHSLGNMLVSASRQFHGLQYEKYLMLNAAVPIEAYDPDGGISEESKRAMTPTVWRPYPDRVRSSHWYELFADTQGDERSRLTWKGLFRDVDNTVNFYSTRDEVVANGDGSWKWPLTRKFAWYNQEWARGAYLVSLSPLAGWKFSTYYSKTDVVGHLQGEEVYGPRRYTPTETFEISDESLKEHPFFWGFRDAELYGEGGSAFLQANPYVLWYALSHGIPAESFAAGANPVPKWGGTVQGNIMDYQDYGRGLICNVNMAMNCVPRTEVDDENEDEEELPWIHSYFIENSLFDTSVLYEAIVEQIGSTKPREAR